MRTSTEHPLQQQQLLQLVLSFVGHLYMSLVKSFWRAEYQVVALLKRCGHEYHEASCTSYAAAFASVPRLELAIGADLRMKLMGTNCRKQLHHAAGRHAKIPTLRLAIELGLQLTRLVAEGAIESRDIEKLRWLCTEKACR
jgi:hypothetical protein